LSDIRAFGEVQHVGKLFQFGQTSQHAGTVDHQFPDRVHHLVQALERDADGFRLRQCRRNTLSENLLGNFFFGRLAWLERRHEWRLCRGDFGCLRRDRQLRPLLLSAPAWRMRASSDSRWTAWSFIGPLAIQEFLSVSTTRGRISMICALDAGGRRAGDPPDLPHVSDARDALQSNLRRRPFYRVYGAEQAMDLLRPGVGFQ